MKSKIFFSIGLTMLILGIIFSAKSDIMLIGGILGGGIIGYSYKLIVHNKNT
ncbi:hypothetical protein [Clostridium oryzae]|uniref:Uncharacterized protein n=1 Tax=Clostridium oryzae TaxID=1450648 RepID=A0A1V4IQB8_9CLOT|nr:hypothetical protein [Clostridium oryzae]OPJ62103.1 hypothetical protein CLORY_19260 [Clostridium oryzae]